MTGTGRHGLAPNIKALPGRAVRLSKKCKSYSKKVKNRLKFGGDRP